MKRILLWWGSTFGFHVQKGKVLVRKLTGFQEVYLTSVNNSWKEKGLFLISVLLAPFCQYGLFWRCLIYEQTVSNCWIGGHSWNKIICHEAVNVFSPGFLFPKLTPVVNSRLPCINYTNLCKLTGKPAGRASLPPHSLHLFRPDPILNRLPPWHTWPIRPKKALVLFSLPEKKTFSSNGNFSKDFWPSLERLTLTIWRGARFS